MGETSPTLSDKSRNTSFKENITNHESWNFYFRSDIGIQPITYHLIPMHHFNLHNDENINIYLTRV